MSEPTCRVCYAKTLSPDERDRFYAEPVTSCIHLCDEHQRSFDEVLAAMPPIKYVRRSNTPLRFTTAEESNDE